MQKKFQVLLLQLMVDPLHKMNNNPIFIHSDTFHGINILKKYRYKINPNNISLSILDFIIKFTNQSRDGLIFPAFNYDFGKTKIFNPEMDPVQVGALPEWIRNNTEYYRSNTPFFSVLSQYKEKFDFKNIVNPFGDNSVFNWLVSTNSMILLFGTNLSSLTFIHYVEEITGKPLYRYKKKFNGQVITKDKIKKCKLEMHVRPFNTYINYDWIKLERDLILNKLFHIDKKSYEIKLINSKKLLEFWGNKISEDPFYLLDKKSINYFKIITEGGTKRVKIEDYEN
jgi:aminoglycoside 3-N-acetyltransferase